MLDAALIEFLQERIANFIIELFLCAIQPLPPEFKADAWCQDTIVLLTSWLFIKRKKNNFCKEPLFPLHKASQYSLGLVHFDDMHDFPTPSAGLFDQDFEDQQQFTIGSSATPIKSTENFLFTMSFLGHPKAKFSIAEASSMHSALLHGTVKNDGPA